MKQLNRYYRRSKISEAKFRRLLRYFALDLTASDAARLSGLSVRSVNAIYLRLRQRLLEDCERNAPEREPHVSEVEVDESYFGPRRVRGKRGRGAGKKTPVFGILERGGHVYTEIVPNCSKRVLQGVIRGRVALATAIHSDGWRGYDGLVDVGYAKHFRVKHRDAQFANGSAHINGIESFWSFAKRRMVQFNGVPAATFALHLKETEWRFNHRGDGLYRDLLKLLRAYPL